jgi:peptidoglycan/LPS O-acetylase OafA/YrhL
MTPPLQGADRLGYRPALDGIRAIAILMVLLVHTGAFLVPGAHARLLPAGSLGVDVFFVLSGFLITTLLLERRGEPRPLAAFYLRRALRLLPAVLVLLAGDCVIALAEGEPPRTIANTVGAVLTYTTNWAPLAGVTIERHVLHLWSLAIEEQFYALWPLVLLGVLALGRTRVQLLRLTVALAVASALWRASLWQSGESWLRIYLRPDARADSLLAGAALALLPWQRLAAVPERRRTLAGVAALAGLLAAAQLLMASSALLYLGGYTLIALLAVTLVSAVLPGTGPLARYLGSPGPVAVGRLSYSLYLWHFPLFIVVGEHTAGWPGAVRVVFAWVLTFGVATASHLLVERPALTLKDRVGRSAPRGVQTAS